MDRYKLLAADDEQIALDSVSFIVSKQFGENLELTTARSGREVIETARSFQPDIVLMDILMPGIDGLAAISEIKRFVSGALFIIVSAYEKFDYVKEALGLGVIDYLSKPVSRGRMVAALENALRIKEKEEEKLNRELAMREKMAMALPMLESGFIYSLISSGGREQELINYKTLLGLQGESGYVMTVEFGEETGQGGLTNKIGSGFRSQQHYSVLHDAIKGCCNCIVGPVMLNRIVTFVPCAAGLDEYSQRTGAVETAEAVYRKLRDVSQNVGFVIGIGRWCARLSAGYQSYEDSLHAIAGAPQEGGVVHIGDFNPREGGCYPEEAEKLMLRQIAAGDFEDALRSFDRIWEWSMEEFGGRFQDRLAGLTELCVLLGRAAKENGVDVPPPAEMMKEYGSLSSDTALNSWLRGRIRTYCEESLALRQSKLSSIVRRAKEFIAENFTRELSLEEVSKECSVSPTYFSKLFKDEMGCSFVEYLTGLRMEKAKQLLSDSRFQGKEICYQIGYADPNYFSRIFKKNVGMTPTEYRTAQSGGKT